MFANQIKGTDVIPADVLLGTERKAAAVDGQTGEFTLDAPDAAGVEVTVVQLGIGHAFIMNQHLAFLIVARYRISRIAEDIIVKMQPVDCYIFAGIDVQKRLEIARVRPHLQGGVVCREL